MTTETGMFAVDVNTRTVRGTLIPWGVRSRESASKTKPITFPRGSVRVPRDPLVVGLNAEHDRFSPLGRATVLEDREAGLFAEFTIADTDEGDAWLLDHDGLVALSAEVRDITRAIDDTGAAALTGAAVVREPAFEGAGLFSALEAEKPAPETPDPAPAEPATQPDTEPVETQEDDMAEATVPETMLASRRKTPDPAPQLTKQGFFAALHTARKTGDFGALQPYAEDAEKTGLFALTDIAYDGAAGLTVTGGIPTQWLGQLWQGRRFQRRIVPLISGGVLTSTSAHGWLWTVKPAVAAWAGNKTAVPSNAPTVGPKTYTAQRFAGAHDLAREYYDFNVTEVIESYVDAMVDSYAYQSDGYALAQLVAGATTFVPGAATENSELMAVIDGALAVIAAQATPSFAIVAPDIYRGVIGTPHSEALEYFSAAVGLEDGQSAGFRIIPDARLAARQVIVGAKEAAVAWELPGSPIRVSIPDLVKGGVDEGFFGYIATGVTYPAAIVKATVAAPAAASSRSK